MTREDEIERIATQYAAGSIAVIPIYTAFKNGVRYADKHPVKKQTVTIDAWVARDWTGLYLSDIKPRLKRSYPELDNIGPLFFISKNKEIFPTIKDIADFGEPRKVKVTIELEEEQ